MCDEKYGIKTKILEILYNVLGNTPIDYWNEYTELESVYKRQGILKCIEEIEKNIK